MLPPPGALRLRPVNGKQAHISRMSAVGHTGTNKKEKGQVGHDLASLRKLIADSKFSRQPISRISELGLLPPPSFAHNHLVPKQ
jgi:hypothetical protein